MILAYVPARVALKLSLLVLGKSHRSIYHPLVPDRFTTMAAEIRNHIAVIDFGSQYTRLIVRRVREAGYFAMLYHPQELASIDAPAAVILSGGPRSTADADAPDFDFDYLRSLDIPVLGICYGMQLSNIKWGGLVARSERREFGPAELVPAKGTVCPLFDGVRAGTKIWMSHSDTVSKIPAGATVTATNQHGTPVALQWADRYFGIQFHPEVTHTEDEGRILRNFLKLCPDAKPFAIDSLRDEICENIKAQLGEHEVVCGVSGGVDSTVLAVLLKHAGVKLRPIFVDTGLLRQDESVQVQAGFAQLGIDILTVDASDRFLDALAGVDDPEKKREVIGNLFIDVFFDAAHDIDILAQGTLYPDVIESASSGSIASKIKTHHNRVDRILELQKEGRVIEPLAELFKDEVRALGRSLDIPDLLLDRHPFPGPGLAVRCPGEVREDKLRIIREADHIFIGELRSSGWYERTWQAYAALIPVKTVGVKGDERSYEFAISLRAVISEDAMTADWVELPADLLRKVSTRILNEVAGVNRVLYDISSKPPASIEWE